MPDEVVDIEDEAGNVVGKLDLSTMRALAPHPELDKAVANGGSLFMRRNGMRTPVSIDGPKKRRRGR